jgi:hypothetical protein
LHFSPEQIRVVAESLGNEILRGRRESANRQDEIDRLNREIMDLTEMLEREKKRR